MSAGAAILIAIASVIVGAALAYAFVLRTIAKSGTRR